MLLGIPDLKFYKGTNFLIKNFKAIIFYDYIILEPEECAQRVQVIKVVFFRPADPRGIT